MCQNIGTPAPHSETEEFTGRSVCLHRLHCPAVDFCLAFILPCWSAGPPRMSPKSQRAPRAHRVQPCRTAGVPPGVELISHGGDGPMAPQSKSNSSGGTWSSVVSGGRMSLWCSSEESLVCGIGGDSEGPICNAGALIGGQPRSLFTYICIVHVCVSIYLYVYMI